MSYCDALTWRPVRGASSESRALDAASVRAAYDVRATTARHGALLSALMALAAEHSHELLGATLRHAQDFAIALPDGQEPELAVDRDGYIAFEWMSADGDVVTVRVAPSGHLVYAAYVGDGQWAGTGAFTGVVPHALREAIQAFLHKAA